MDLASLVRNIPDFPKPGVQFKDITTLLKNGEAFHYIIDFWKDRYADQRVDAIVGADARGFVFGAPLAYAMNLPFIPVRKQGKLPGECITESFDLEYGASELSIHVDALSQGNRVVLVDDLLATGGTMAAMCKLVERLGAEIIEIAFVIELPPLKGRTKIEQYPIHSLIEFMVA